MISDDERREVAKRLRELPTDMYEVEELWEMKGLDTCCKDQTDYYLIHFALFGCFPADHMHPCDYEELHMRLADLIEPDEPRVKCVAEVKVDGERLEQLVHDAAVELTGIDRDALLALADEMESLCGPWSDCGKNYAPLIREACGEVEE